jgi:hypothetical protein
LFCSIASQDLGLFKTNPWWYLYKTITTFAFVFAAFFLVAYDYSILAAFSLGIGLQQLGWLGYDSEKVFCICCSRLFFLFFLSFYFILMCFSFCFNIYSHDYSHHQVFPDRKYNRWMGYVTGNIGQGFSQRWWDDR